MFSSSAHKYNVPVFKKDQPDDSFKFQPLPSPTDKYPYHLDVSATDVKLGDQKLVFHMVGDTGSIRSPDFQKLVAAQMEAQFVEADEADKPAFLFHLGDVVYNHGEVERYQTQFFEPYKDYPRPIFAIAGNHDSDVNPDNPVPYKSLDAFMKVFCAGSADVLSFSGNNARKSMMQPNVYWMLNTPLANIIGLYGNVTKFGSIEQEQRDWYISQLNWVKKNEPEKALIVCVHHAPYTADINHGSSEEMIRLFDNAYKETGVKPDIVFSGHVHNYQRFSKKYADGGIVPFIVAGAGGYDELHPVALRNDNRFTSESTWFDGVHLENYCDDKHGFLNVSIEKNKEGLLASIKYYTIPHEKIMEGFEPAQLADEYTWLLDKKG